MTSLRRLLLVVATLTVISLISIDPSAASTKPLTVQCSAAIQQLISCLNFAKGAATVPTKECCTSVSDMKEKQPVCLCFFIGQAHNGSEQIKSLGIQEDKLLQLPSACHLTNASASDCPRLLGMSPSSPASAIFMKNGTTSSAPGSASSVSSPTSDSSRAMKQGVLTTLAAVLVSTIILSALSFATSLHY